MSEVIRFLASAGAAPSMSPAAYSAAIAHLDADQATKSALMQRDGERLAEIIGQRQAMVCAVFLPEEEEVPVDRETLDA